MEENDRYEGVLFVEQSTEQRLIEFERRLFMYVNTTAILLLVLKLFGVI